MLDLLFVLFETPEFKVGVLHPIHIRTDPQHLSFVGAESTQGDISLWLDEKLFKTIRPLTESTGKLFHNASLMASFNLFLL